MVYETVVVNNGFKCLFLGKSFLLERIAQKTSFYRRCVKGMKKSAEIRKQLVSIYAFPFSVLFYNSIGSGLVPSIF